MFLRMGFSSTCKYGALSLFATAAQASSCMDWDTLCEVCVCVSCSWPFRYHAQGLNVPPIKSADCFARLTLFNPVSPEYAAMRPEREALLLCMHSTDGLALRLRGLTFPFPIGRCA